LSADESIRRPNRAQGAVDKLPEEVRFQIRDWFTEKVTYDRMAEATNALLAADGIATTVSRSQIVRWCARHRDNLERIERANEQAEILRKKFVGDGKDISEEAEALCKAVLFEGLLDADKVKAQTIEDVAKIGHTLGKLASSKTARDKWEFERRKKTDTAVEELKAEMRALLEDDPERTLILMNLVDEARDKILEKAG
jgi:hypothetical protein